MKMFTIESETHNITAYRTAKEAASVAGAERFASADALAGLAANWPSARLVGIWNSLPGATPVRKFKDRQTAVKRIWNAVQSLGEPVASQAASQPPAPVQGGTDQRASGTKRTARTAPPAKGARQGSQTEKILDLLKRPGGASLKEILKATEWQAHSVRGFISGMLGKKMGLTVVTARNEDGDRTCAIEA